MQTTTTPLALAADAIAELFGHKPSLHDKYSFGFLLKPSDDNHPPFDFTVRWSPSRGLLALVISIDFDLSPLRDPKKTARMLENSIEPFLEGYYDRVVPSGLNIHMDSESCTPYFEMALDYEPYDDDEILVLLNRTLVRGMRTLCFLTPIFASMEKGYFPNAEERMELLCFEHGRWEVSDKSSDLPSDRVRMPKRIFSSCHTVRAH